MQAENALEPGVNALEFDALRALLGRYVRSPLGQAELLGVRPLANRADIESALADAAEAIDYLRAASNPQPAGRGAAIRPRFDLAIDPAPLVGRLRIEGATLEAAEIFELARLLDVASEARSVVLSARERYPRLAAHASSIADLRELARDLRGKILPDGTLADDASVMLGRLRRDSERQRRMIEESLARFLRTHHEDGTLQEDFVTIRNDRFVVPIVTGRERRVDGVIHGSSGSGHTVFVEPLETIELNNELVRLHEEELREVHRLLREFTTRLREHAVQIAASVTALSRLELLFGKAEFALDFRCTVPRLSPERSRRIVLRDARHPLLEDILRGQRKPVVPVSLELNDAQNTLLISGPNTGGKTVALKTIGLLALMTHAGLPVPAEEAEFPLFDEVLADIGDHQSLAESLSSFSSHIVAVRSMLERATRDSLVLLDELGRATDPVEGGALGVTVLETFRARGAFTLASTHLMAMKVYGASTSGVLNGSMGFDEATLEPTYVLRLGAPGKSAGLDIASRLGLDPALIETARGRMAASDRDVAQFLGELNQRLEQLETERTELAARTQALVVREQGLEQTWERKYSAKIREVEDRATELSAQFERRAQETIEDLSQKARARIAKTRREFQEQVTSLAPAPERGTVAPLKLEVGAQVRLKGIRQPATVRRVLESGEVEVDAGYLKMRVPLTDVEEVIPKAQTPARAPSIAFRQGPEFAVSVREINLIGRRAEEACDSVDKFLDTAALAQAERVRIVHGHGMGILRKAIAELLARNPHVAKFYAARPEEGGTGATIVELK
ncbi:MAG: Smr protein/MutS2 [Bryobacterales bacterium]|nr:Smr protein/MutS2 [Bryobacterales bacterium]